VSIVLDASIVMSWRFEDEKTEAAEAVLDHVGRYGALAPSLWPLEVANALLVAVRRRRISPTYVETSLRELAKLNVKIDPDTAAHAWKSTMSLAQAHGLTGYDAAYLELAHRRQMPLASLDRKLRAAGAASGLELLGL
jgi:predicted nucleic acid-binding protein